MATTFTVGQTLPLSIAFLDQFGKAMSPTPATDTPPSWTNGTPATDTLTVAADGLSATDLGVTAGSDTINLGVAVAGKTFTATLDVSIVAAVQVLSSVNIVPGTPA